jgi:LmbE family N-acetylglucosaminyl deacetylase
MNPPLMDDIASGIAVITVYLTAGDAGRDEKYWHGRENGVRAAYTSMGASQWRNQTLFVAGVNIAASVSSDDKVMLVFIRLPDGGHSSVPFSGIRALLRRRVSLLRALERLWEGEEISTVDSLTKYSRERLIMTLTEFINHYKVDKVFTHDPEGWIAGSDHIDHLYTGRFTSEAVKRVGVQLIFFKSFDSDQKSSNLTDVIYQRKCEILEIYSRHDQLMPNPLNNYYKNLLKRSISRIAS